MRIDDDTIVGEGGRITVDVVDVVRNDEVNLTAGRAQLPAQLDPGAFCVYGPPSCLTFQILREVDAKVVRLYRVPPRVRNELRVCARRDDERAREKKDEEEFQRRGRDLKYASRPSTIDLAYRS